MQNKVLWKQYVHSKVVYSDGTTLLQVRDMSGQQNVTIQTIKIFVNGISESPKRQLMVVGR